MTDKIAVIIPCYNEEKSIIAVIDEVRGVLPNAEIYVFDNNSTDKSADLVRAKIAELSNGGGGGEFHAQNSNTNLQSNSSNLDNSYPNNPNSSKLYLHFVSTQGKGAVIADAFAFVEADIFVMIDADLECDTSILPRALQVFSEQNLDMLNIARSADSVNLYRKGHKFGNTLFTKTAQILFGKHFNDLLSGYRIFSRAFVKTFPATSKGFEIETELSVFALQCGLRVGEIEAPYRSRLQGSFSKLRTFRDGFKILFMILQLLFTERPLFVFGALSAICFALSLILGVPIVVEFMQTSQVPRFPTAFICVGFGVVGVVLGIAGLLAHLVARNCKEMRRFFYLLHKGKNSSSRASETSVAIHESKMDCHDSAIAESRNDETPCHIERSEISQNRDISFSAKTQYDKNLDSSLPTKAQNDNITSSDKI